MDFVIDTEFLSNYVNLIGKVVKSKSNLPILGNIYIKAEKDKVLFIGTDLEVQIVANLDAVVKKTGVTTVNANLFIQYVNSLKKEGDVRVFLNKNTLTVQSKSSKATFSTRSADDFPLFDNADYTKSFSIKASKLNLMIEKTIFSTAKDDFRPILTGINVEIDNNSLVFVSLDTFRLSLIKTKKFEATVDGYKNVIPAQAFGIVDKILKDSIVNSFAKEDIVNVYNSKDKNFIKFEYSNVVVYTRVLDGDYPNYKEIIPADFSLDVNIKKDEFLQALRRVGVFAQSAVSQRVILTFKDNVLTLESTVPELGSVNESVELLEPIDKEFKIAFQLRFLTEIVTLIDDEIVNMRGINKLSPVEFRQPSLKDEFLHLLMPLKLDE